MITCFLNYYQSDVFLKYHHSISFTSHNSFCTPADYFSFFDSHSAFLPKLRPKATHNDGIKNNFKQYITRIQTTF